jgi:hypothetical protein
MKFIKKWLKKDKNKEVLRFTSFAFFAWQVVVLFLFFLSKKLIPATFSYMYTEKLVVNPIWLWSRANFDGMHYLQIAKKGYGLYQQAFFPLYPKLISTLTPVFFGRDLIAGFFISSLSFFLMIFFFYKLVKLDYSEKIAKRAILFLLVFPTAFYFSTIYTESLFLMLVVSSFYFAKTKRWFLAGSLGAFASLTRLPGIFLFPAFLVEFYYQNLGLSKRKINKKNFFFIFLIPLGLLYYMGFLNKEFSDPLMFITVQSNFGAGREPARLILLYQVFWRYLKMIFTVKFLSLTYFIVFLEFLSGLVFLGLTILSFLKKMNSYFVFMALSFILPTLTGNFLSMPRFVLTLFPGFIILSLISEKHLFIRKAYLTISIILFIICLMLFSQGYWLA